jgi:D-alanyl-D-alanine dipeptidase
MRGSWLVAVAACAGGSAPADRGGAAEVGGRRAAVGLVPAVADAAVPAPADAAADAAAVERADDLVDVAALLPDVVLDLRYATAANFTGAVLYPVARCRLRRAVAARLAIAVAALRPAHRRLRLWDCYRPASIQRVLWARVPDPRYVARPRDAADGTPIDGSRHSRGAAIDLGLAADDGGAVPLPTDFDAFSAAAHRAQALRGPRGVEARRLDEAMRAAGFVGLATEWWHYDAPDSGRYPLADDPL